MENNTKLIDFDNIHTDKNSVHSYLELYDTLLSPIRETASNVLEVGIGDFKDKNGGSLLLWKNYFQNAKIYGLDILSNERVLDELINDEQVILHTSINAYDENFIENNLKNIKFDFMLDDGPHTLISQQNFIKLYSPLLNDNGILIVEDVQSIDWIESLTNITPDELKQYIKIYDLRKNKNRYDDIVFTIDKINN